MSKPSEASYYDRWRWPKIGLEYDQKMITTTNIIFWIWPKNVQSDEHYFLNLTKMLYISTSERMLAHAFKWLKTMKNTVCRCQFRSYSINNVCRCHDSVIFIQSSWIGQGIIPQHNNFQFFSQCCPMSSGNHIIDFRSETVPSFLKKCLPSPGFDPNTFWLS